MGCWSLTLAYLSITGSEFREEDIWGGGDILQQFISYCQYNNFVKSLLVAHRDSMTLWYISAKQSPNIHSWILVSHTGGQCWNANIWISQNCDNKYKINTICWIMYTILLQYYSGYILKLDFSRYIFIVRSLLKCKFIDFTKLWQ